MFCRRLLGYGLLSVTSPGIVTCVEDIASSVTHARFVGTDHSADEVVLWEILSVLKTLILGPVGHLLSNESVCELLNSCFRICFETRLSELLRNCTEDALLQMIALLFARLPYFTDDSSSVGSKKLKMKTGAQDSKAKSSLKKSYKSSETLNMGTSVDSEKSPLPIKESVSKESLAPETLPLDSASIDSGIITNSNSPSENAHEELSKLEDDKADPKSLNVQTNDASSASLNTLENTFVNTLGVKFTPTSEANEANPYGMACVREVLRFLVSLTSPTYDQNTPAMIATSLGLVTVALEVGGEHINKCPSLLQLVKDQLCRNLMLLVKPEVKLHILMAALRVCILVFDCLRSNLKFQLEMFIKRLLVIITLDAPNLYSHKELALETIVRLWRIPGLITELFVNFDCDLYSDNIFEDLTKILSKNAYPEQGLYSTNLLSLEALLTVIETLESHLASPQKQLSENDGNELPPSKNVISPSSGYLVGVNSMERFITPKMKAYATLRDGSQLIREHLLALKEKKKLLATGTDQFNVKPEKGIQFLQDNNILGQSNDDIAILMKENPKLCKKMIGEYVSKKKNVGILHAFVKSFDFKGLRIDQCLRTFMETFRLPGEAPLISIVIEHFSSHWHSSNDNPFAKDDAAFLLAYAVIMLNVDQHNQNAKKQNVPMTVDQFRNNLRGVNGDKDFDPAHLEEIYNGIVSDEIIMPAEQTGLVKENYLWKMLLKRGNTKDGKYMLANNDHCFDRDLFTICWGPTVASLSYVFHKSTEDSFIQNSVNGFKKCAGIAARYGMSDVLDNLVVSLCKFTGLLSSNASYDAVAIEFGGNAKSQLAAKMLIKLVIQHGDILREGWKNVVEILMQCFRCRLLPDSLTLSPDLLEGNISLMKPTSNSAPRVEPSLLSSLYSAVFLGDGGARGNTPEDEENRARAVQCIHDCHIERLIRESAFLRHDALNDMLKALMSIGDGSSLVTGLKGPPSDTPGEESLDEYMHAFILELVVQMIIANKDRALAVWPRTHEYFMSLVMSAATAGTEPWWLVSRCVGAMFRLGGVLVRRPDMASIVMQSLRVIFMIPQHVMPAVASQIVAGVHELLSLTADHISHPGDWSVVFALLETAGAGAKPTHAMVLPQHNTNMPQEAVRSLPDSEVSYSSGPDSGHCSEPGESKTPHHAPNNPFDEPKNPFDAAENPVDAPRNPFDTPKNPFEQQKAGESSEGASSPMGEKKPEGWILVDRAGTTNQWDIVHSRSFFSTPLSADACVRSVNTLAFLVKQRHMTAASLPHAVSCARTFVEASLHGGRRETAKSPVVNPRKKTAGRRRDDKQSSSDARASGKASSDGGRKKTSSGSLPNAYDADESDSNDATPDFHNISERLLDLLDTLHTSAGSVVSSSQNKEDTQPAADSGVPSSGIPHSVNGETDKEPVTLDLSSGSLLWQEVLCPLLQGWSYYHLFRMKYNLFFLYNITLQYFFSIFL